MTCENDTVPEVITMIKRARRAIPAATIYMKTKLHTLSESVVQIISALSV